MKAPSIVAFLALAMAGCSGDADEPVGPIVLPPDKGGIEGLLLNDVYRPIAGGLVLLQQAGLTATTDADGAFRFVGLEPGTHLLRVDAAGHEAAPVNVDVVAGQFSEVELPARRIFSDDGAIIVTQYAVFIPCALSSVQGTNTVDCTADASGDTFRGGFTSNYTGHDDATVLVTEMRANQEASTSRGAFKVVVRELGACDTGTCSGDYWGSRFTADGDYVRIVMRKGEVSTDDTEARNVAWNNTKHMETFLFPQGAFKQETQGLVDTTCGTGALNCFESRGLGPQMGVKATFVQSLFIGEPTVDINAYQVLGPTS